MTIRTPVLCAALLVGQAAFGGIITYDATLNGAPESTSTGTGTAVVTVDTVANTLDVMITFSGLTTGTTASHIHCCTTNPGVGTVGVATTLPTFPGFPLGVTSGTYSHLFDLTLASTYNAAFVTAAGGTVTDAEMKLLQGIASDVAYVNIHTTQFPGGEISGFLVTVPEPGTVLLMGIGFAAVLMRRRT